MAYERGSVLKKNFTASDWKRYLPRPICEEYPEYEELYDKAWELARAHVRDIPGMPQNPYMDEAFCDTQVWVWDTCFMSMFCKFAQAVFPGVETFRNFYEVIHCGRCLPSITPTENEPFWTGAIAGVPKNIEVHIADNPPLFAWCEYENALIHGERAYLQDLLYHQKYLQKHYDWIENLTEQQTLRGVHAPTCLIHVRDGYHWEGGRSGMDNTPRGRKGKTAQRERPKNADMLWIDAICQQALSAKALSNMFGLLGDLNEQTFWYEKFEEKQKLINDLYWDDVDRFYYDIDAHDHSFYKVKTIASYWTMTAGVATRERAIAMAERLKREEDFGGTLPLVSLAKDDADFSPKGKYWRGSMWLPTAYATLKGLSEYEMYADAHLLAHRILQYMLRTYRDFEPHTIWECYAPEGYRPATQVNDETFCRPDFCGWSALGPISIYMEYVLGFHTINAFENIVKWAKPDTFKGNIGIQNLRFGDVVTNIVANEKACTVISNRPYTLEINEKNYAVREGRNILEYV